MVLGTTSHQTGCCHLINGQLSTRLRPSRSLVSRYARSAPAAGLWGKDQAHRHVRLSQSLTVAITEVPCWQILHLSEHRRCYPFDTVCIETIGEETKDDGRQQGCSHLPKLGSASNSHLGIPFGPRSRPNFSPHLLPSPLPSLALPLDPSILGQHRNPTTSPGEKAQAHVHPLAPVSTKQSQHGTFSNLSHKFLW